MFPVFLLCFVLVFPSFSYAANPRDEYKKIQEKMQEQKRRLNETQQRESSILGELDACNATLGKIEVSLRKHRSALSRTQAEIAQVNAEIAAIREKLDKQKEWMKRKLRTMSRFELGYAADSLALVMNGDDIPRTMRTWKYFEYITRYEHGILGAYRENLKNLDERNNRLKGLEKELRVNSEKVRSKEQELASQKRSKEVLLVSVRNEKAVHQRMLRELDEASRKLLDMIRESSKTDTFGATGFSKLKGRLPWPAAGRLAVPYGSQKDPQFDTPVFRNGIHIRTDADADARSVHSGKVIFAEWFKGFGQLVIVNHGGGYHSLYGNLSEIFSHVGDIIRENQVIGKVGTSGVLNAPGLYFEIRYKGKPLDPIQWLKNKRG